MVEIYSACVPPRRFDRYLRYGQRKLGIGAPTNIIQNVSHAQALIHRDFPISTNIVLGNSCNLQCSHCGYHGPLAPAYFKVPAAMSWDIVERLKIELSARRQFAKFGAFEEPLLYWEKFAYLANAFIENGVGVHLTTNGTLIRPERVSLLQHLRTLYVSLDAATASTYKRIRGGDYARVLENVLVLASCFQGVQMGTSFIRQPKSAIEEAAFIDYWLPRIGMVILYALLVFNKDGYEIDQPFLASPKSRVICSSPWLETYVMPNGDVSLCCQTLVQTGRDKNIPIMGNILNDSIQSIWNGKMYETYRKALVDQDWSIAQICEKCPLWAASWHTVDRTGKLKITQNPTTKVIETIG